MPSYPTPRLRVTCDPAEVPAGYARPVHVTAEVLDPVPNVHYWFRFDTTDGEIKRRAVWGTRSKNRVVASVRWHIAGVGPAEAAVDVDATIYLTRQHEGEGEATGSDATILRITETEVDVDFDIEQGEDCGEFTEVRQGELICFHGEIKPKKGAEDLVYEPRMWAGDQELEVQFVSGDPTHFRAFLNTDLLSKGFHDVSAEVTTRRISRKRRSDESPTDGPHLPDPVRPDQRA